MYVVVEWNILSSSRCELLARVCARVINENIIFQFNFGKNPVTIDV